MAEPNTGEKLLKLNAEGIKQLEKLEADIPKVERQLEALSEILDITPLREKIEWTKKMAKTLKENFT